MKLEGVLFPPGGLKPLFSISPSRYCALSRCKLRELWACAGEPSRLPSSPAARVGAVIHKLLERAERGEFPAGNVEAIHRSWYEAISLAESRMSQEWLERHFVPLRRWMRGLET